MTQDKRLLIVALAYGLCFFFSETSQGGILSGSVSFNGPLEDAIIVQTWLVEPGNRALRLDGAGDFVKTSLTDLSGSELTIQFWFKGQTYQSAVRQQNGALEDFEAEWSGRNSEQPPDRPMRGWVIAGWNGYHILSNDGLLNGIYAGFSVTNGHWHHFVMSWKQNALGGFASYLDGEPLIKRDSCDNPIPNYDANVYLGSLHELAEFSNG